MVIKRRLRKDISIVKNQFSFMLDRSTTEEIHLIRSLIESYTERKKDLHRMFIDLEKACERVPYELLQECLENREVPMVYIRAIKDMYKDIQTSVRTSGGDTEDFPNDIGLHQG